MTTRWDLEELVYQRLRDLADRELLADYDRLLEVWNNPLWTCQLCGDLLKKKWQGNPPVLCTGCLRVRRAAP